MPTYEYKCSACGHRFEKFQSIMADPVRKCPECGKRAVERLISGGAGLIFKGSGFYQTRPVWGQSENFFNAVAGVTKEESGLADAYYRLYGGGVGGPVVKNRTFFWVATESYRQKSPLVDQYALPTALERAGFRLDYFETAQFGKESRVVAAAWIGNVRLIDNILMPS